MPIQQICTVVEKTWLSHDAVYMVLEAGDMVRQSFRGPGQFVHIKCGESRLLRRPISVSSCMEDEPDDLLALVFESRGEGTEWLANRVVGDKLDVLGLLGNGFDVDWEDRYLLVGGGIGVPPLRGCAQCAQESDAILGFRSADKTLLIDEFRAECGSVQIATDDGSLGYHGFVDALVRQELEEHPGEYDGVLACGPKPMLKSVAAVCAQLDTPCQVSMEERMGCGVGACLVCACKNTQGHYVHVCKDGPVFPAQEVDWNE